MFHVSFVLAAGLYDELLQDIVVTSNDADFELVIAPIMAAPSDTSDLKQNMRLKFDPEGVIDAVPSTSDPL
jgi:hypothetical protein